MIPPSSPGGYNTEVVIENIMIRELETGCIAVLSCAIVNGLDIELGNGVLVAENIAPRRPGGENGSSRYRGGDDETHNHASCLVYIVLSLSSSGR